MSLEQVRDALQAELDRLQAEHDHHQAAIERVDLRRSKIEQMMVILAEEEDAAPRPTGRAKARTAPELAPMPRSRTPRVLPAYVPPPPDPEPAPPGADPVEGSKAAEILAIVRTAGRRGISRDELAVASPYGVKSPAFQSAIFQLGRRNLIEIEGEPGAQTIYPVPRGRQKRRARVAAPATEAEAEPRPLELEEPALEPEPEITPEPEAEEEPDGAPEEQPEVAPRDLRVLLATPLATLLSLPTRMQNYIDREGLVTVGDLARLDPKLLLGAGNLGKKTVHDTRAALETFTGRRWEDLVEIASEAEAEPEVVTGEDEPSAAAPDEPEEIDVPVHRREREEAPPTAAPSRLPPAPSSPLALTPAPASKAPAAPAGMVKLGPFVEDVQKVKDRTERFKCVVLGCVLSAGACADRQDAANIVSRGSNSASNAQRATANTMRMCKTCTTGQIVVDALQASARGERG